MMSIGPPQHGQAGISAFALRRSPPSTSIRVDGASRSSRQRASIAARWPFANSPEWRMRWNPAGSTCSRKRPVLGDVDADEDRGFVHDPVSLDTGLLALVTVRVARTRPAGRRVFARP